MKHLLRVSLLLGVFFVGLTGCDSSPSSLVFVDVTPANPRLGESAVVRFQALDGNRVGKPGVNVTFALQGDNTGVTIAPTQATTDAGGYAATSVTSSDRVTSIVVTATTGSGLAAVAVDSPTISYAGGSSSSRQFTFQCGPINGPASGGVHGISTYDQSRSLIAGTELECTAHVGDRNGDGIVGAAVSFLTEAGTIEAIGTSATDSIGNATIHYKSSLPLPLETTPTQFSWTPVNDEVHTGDYLVPLWMDPWLWSENPIATYVPGSSNGNLNEPRRNDPIRPGFQLNPRDNLVSLIAITQGDEAYDDDNNNGVHDANETFTDLTEPFVDSNDNGTWDPGERYVDTNGDAQWNGKNGQYDANTTIWAQERILWTGIPDFDYDTRPPTPVIRVLSGAGGLTVPHFGSDLFAFAFSDPWFNAMARDDDADDCNLGASQAVVKSIPESFVVGPRLQYPSVDYYTVFVTDSHDPNALSDNGDPIPPFANPVAFEIPIICNFTASFMGGFKLTFSPATVSGTVR